MKREPIAEYFRIAVLEVLGSDSPRGAQARIAKAAGISTAYLNDILKRRVDGSEDVRRAISAALGRGYEDFINRGREILGSHSKSKPEDATVLADELEINLKWLLTGEGPARGRVSIDIHTLQEIMEGVEEELVDKQTTLDPGKKSRLVAALYEHSIKARKKMEKEAVRKYLNLISR